MEPRTPRTRAGPGKKTVGEVKGDYSEPIVILEAESQLTSKERSRTRDAWENSENPGGGEISTSRDNGARQPSRGHKKTRRIKATEILVNRLVV